MNEQSHTPGPWRIRDGSVSRQLLISQDGKYSNICAVYATSKGEDMPQRANARLIAAAPELLKRVKKILKHSENYSQSMMSEDARQLHKAEDSVKNLIEWIEGK